jgi:hypothetical protein
MTDGIFPGPLLHREVLQPGQGWSRVLSRGQALRLTDTTGTACLALLAYNARQTNERYNMPDSLKAQYTAFLTAGRVLMSDMGRVLLSITADSCGWHDTLGGHGDADELLAAFGPSTYQVERNAYRRNTRDNLLVELCKYDMGVRDLHANVNLFARIGCAENGTLSFIPGNSHAGATIDLRAEMDVLVVLSNTPHPLDPATVYPPGPIALAIYQAPPVSADDACRISRHENRRAFALTEGSW